MVCEEGRSLHLFRTVAKLAPHSLSCSIGASIIIISTDGSIKAPVITLQGEKSNPYGVVEKHFRPDILIGAERFWKVGFSCLSASAEGAAAKSQGWQWLSSSWLPAAVGESRLLPACPSGRATAGNSKLVR